LRSVFDSKKLGIGINQTIYEDNYSSIPEVKKLAKNLSVNYRGFVGLKKRPLYTQDTSKDYGLAELSPEAKEFIRKNISETSAFGGYGNNRLKCIDDLVLRHYVNGQLKMFSDDSSPRHKCMCLFTHFRMNPNGDIITCSYDSTRLATLRKKVTRLFLTKKQRAKNLKKSKIVANAG